MNRLFAVLLAGAFAFVPLAGLAQDKPADKDKKASAKKPEAKKEAAEAEKKKRKKVGGCG